MQLTAYFSTTELSCRCGCNYGEGLMDVDPQLLLLLEELRKACGNLPIHITSGCRCQAHDLLLDRDPSGSVVGALKRGRPSYHVLGKAADVVGPPRDVLRAEALHVFADGGVGLPDVGDWIHVDVGPRRRWTYPA